jgi:hypothetical protein
MFCTVQRTQSLALPITKIHSLMRSHGCNLRNAVAQNGFSFTSTAAVHAHKRKVLSPMLEYPVVCSSLALIPSSFSSVSIWHFILGFLSSNDPVLI